MPSATTITTTTTIGSGISQSSNVTLPTTTTTTTSIPAPTTANSHSSAAHRRASLKVLSRNITRVVLGNLAFDTWFYSPYPDNIVLGSGLVGGRLSQQQQQHQQSSSSNVKIEFPLNGSRSDQVYSTQLVSNNGVGDGGGSSRSAAAGQLNPGTAAINIQAPSTPYSPLVPSTSTSTSTDKPVCPILHVCPYCFRYTTSLQSYTQHLSTHPLLSLSTPPSFAARSVPNSSVSPTTSSSPAVSNTDDEGESEEGDDDDDDDDEEDNETEEDTTYWPVPSSALKVYSHAGYTVWDVDGETEKLYCQNLSLFGKLFLEQKSVFFDTSGFHYFVLTYTAPVASSLSSDSPAAVPLDQGSDTAIYRDQSLGKATAGEQNDGIEQPTEDDGRRRTGRRTEKSRRAREDGEDTTWRSSTIAAGRESKRAAQSRTNGVQNEAHEEKPGKASKPRGKRSSLPEKGQKSLMDFFTKGRAEVPSSLSPPSPPSTRDIDVVIPSKLEYEETVTEMAAAHGEARRSKPAFHFHTQVLGFFSKESLSWDANNLACILVFPPFQHRNLGQLLMAVSYKLSGWEWENSVIGGPEKPLSTMGRKSYLRFWSERVARFMMGMTADADGRRLFGGGDEEGHSDDNKHGLKKDKQKRKRRTTSWAHEELTVKEIGDRTGMLAEDVLAALNEMGVCESIPRPPSKRKRKSGGGDDIEDQPDGDGGDGGQPVTLTNMTISRAKVLAWAKEKGVDLVSPVREEGFLGEWALSEDDGEEMEEYSEMEESGVE